MNSKRHRTNFKILLLTGKLKKWKTNDKTAIISKPAWILGNLMMSINDYCNADSENMCFSAFGQNVHASKGSGLEFLQSQYPRKIAFFVYFCEKKRQMVEKTMFFCSFLGSFFVAPKSWLNKKCFIFFFYFLKKSLIFVLLFAFFWSTKSLDFRKTYPNFLLNELIGVGQICRGLSSESRAHYIR